MLIVDIILVAVIGLIIFISAKRGFILTVFDLASGIVACILAKFISPPVAQVIYDSAVKEAVIGFLSQEFTNVENTVAAFMSDASSMFGFLPENIVGFAQNAGLLDFSSISHSLISSITTVEQLEAGIVGPVVVSIINIFSFGIISFVLLIALRIVGVLVSKLVTVTKLGEKLNTSLGAVFGILKGVVYAFLLAVILVIISCFSETVAEYTSASYICTFAGSLLGL